MVETLAYLIPWTFGTLATAFLLAVADRQERPGECKPMAPKAAGPTDWKPMAAAPLDRVILGRVGWEMVRVRWDGDRWVRAYEGGVVEPGGWMEIGGKTA